MYSEYRLSVLRTAAPQIEVANWDLLHSALGLASETMELLVGYDQDNLEEELGDICWYLTLASNACYHSPIFYEVKTITSTMEFVAVVEEFVSLVKKEIIYGNHQYVNACLSVLWAKYQGLVLYHTGVANVEPIMMKNMVKLGKRYKQEFTKEEAENRNDKPDELPS